ncbi:MAG: c-type cytochrome, partial [Planctomycetales bacterium]
KVYPLVKGATTAATHAGTHTAACGVTVYRGNRMGKPFAGNVFVCEPTGSLVTRSIPRPDGASFRADRARPKTDFLASTDPWSRPVSLANGPDGALYVVDMYRKVIEHPQYMPPGLAKTLDLRAGDDRGRIYRITASETSYSRPQPPKSAEDFLALLGDENGWSRDLGQRLLVEGNVAGAAGSLAKLLREHPSPKTRLHAFWTLEGLGKLSAGHVRQATRDAHPRLREHGVRLASRFFQADGVLDLFDALAEDDDAQVRFQALLALGNSDDPRCVDWTAKIMLRDAEDPWFAAGLLTASRTRSAAVTLRLGKDAQVASEGTEAKSKLLSDLASVVGARGDHEELKTLLGMIVSPSASDTVDWKRTASLTGLAEGLSRRGKNSPPTSLAELLSRPPADLKRLATRTQAVLAMTAATASNSKAPLGDRAAAIRLLAYRPLAETEAIFDELLTARQPPRTRSACIAALRIIRDPRSADVILRHWKELGPESRKDAVDMFLSRADATKKLLRAMLAGKAAPSVLSLDQRNRLTRSRDADVKSLAFRIYGEGVSANRKAVVEKYRAALRLSADAQRGRAFFKKICAACHRSGGEGNAVGPDLTDVRDKTRETLLLDVLDPNRAVEPRWVSYSVATTDGRVLSGLLVGESANAVVLRRAEGKQDVVPRAAIEAISASGKSLMPEGVEKDLSPQDVADLIEFLKRQR